MTQDNPISSNMPVSLSDPTFKMNPYPAFTHLRETQPVYHMSLPDGRGLWVITRYDDIVRVLKDSHHFIKDPRKTMTDEQKQQMDHLPRTLLPLLNNLLALDPPDHTRLRKLVQKAFTPRFVETLKPHIQLIADDLLDKVQDQGEMELINDYAFPLPMMVIITMLGIPTEDQRQFREWSSIISAIEATQIDPAYMQRITPAMQDFTNYMLGIFDHKHQHPQSDLISELLQAEEQGDMLNESELLAMIVILFIAGHETTMNLIGNGVVALLRHPDQLQRLRAESNLMELAVEELLRYDSPVESTFSYVAEDVELGGQQLKKGETVLVVLSSANRDRDYFLNPDQLDITRPENRHLAFGQGIHYCLGAPLARIEANIALKTLLCRMPGLKLKTAPEGLRYRSSMHFRGFEEIPLSFARSNDDMVL